MCAVQHEPPRVPLTARPNPLLTPELSSAGMGHPRHGAALCACSSPAFWGAAGHPQRISIRGEIPGVATAGPAAARAARTQRVQD